MHAYLVTLRSRPAPRRHRAGRQRSQPGPESHREHPLLQQATSAQNASDSSQRALRETWRLQLREGDRHRTRDIVCDDFGAMDRRA